MAIAPSQSRTNNDRVIRYADMFSAMGTEPRLRIMQLLLSAHPEGMGVGEIQGELGIPSSTLSHHLDKLKNEDLVNVQRESTFLWYTANTGALQELLGFLYAECCTRNKAVQPDKIFSLCNERQPQGEPWKSKRSSKRNTARPRCASPLAEARVAERARTSMAAASIRSPPIC